MKFGLSGSSISWRGGWVVMFFQVVEKTSNSFYPPPRKWEVFHLLIYLTRLLKFISSIRKNIGKFFAYFHSNPKVNRRIFYNFGSKIWIVSLFHFSFCMECISTDPLPGYRIYKLQYRISIVSESGGVSIEPHFQHSPNIFDWLRIP